MLNHIPSKHLSLQTYPNLKTEQQNTCRDRNAHDEQNLLFMSVNENLNVISNEAEKSTIHREKELTKSTCVPSEWNEDITIKKRNNLIYKKILAEHSYTASNVILDKEQAISKLKEVYTEDYLNASIAGPSENIDELINLFNKINFHEHYDFIDIFSIYDYGKESYIKTNKTLLDIEPAPPRPPQVKQLEISVRHLAMIQANDNESFSSAIPLFRGEVRKNDDFQNIAEGDIFSSPIFLSTTDDQEIADSFLSPKEMLKKGEINVFYTIEKITPYSGAFVSEIMGDEESEFLFLPKTKFVITKKEYNEEARSLHLTLRQLKIDKDDFFTQLNALIQKTPFKDYLSERMNNETLNNINKEYQDFAEHSATEETNKKRKRDEAMVTSSSLSISAQDKRQKREVEHNIIRVFMAEHDT